MTQSKRQSAIHANTPFARAVGEAEMQTALEAAAVGVWNWNIVTGELSWSDELERIHGLAPGAFNGSFEAYLADIHPEDRDEVVASIERAVSNGTEHDVEYRIVLQDGSIRWVAGRGRPVADADGQPILMTGTCQDVTKRCEIEERFTELRRDLEQRLEAQSAESARLTERLAAETERRRHAEATTRAAEEKLRQIQKTETLNQLAPGIAHDFNNLLTVIMVSSDLALQHLDRYDAARLKVVDIRKAAARGAALTRRLLEFSRRDAPGPAVVNVDTAVAETGAMLGRLVGDDIQLAMVHGPSPCRVAIGPGRIDHMLVNLVVNARDAMPEGGRIVVETQRIDSTEPIVGRGTVLEPGRYVTLSVTDTGCGISPSQLERIFEPYFTTKESGRGTGLGLSMIDETVREIGGAIQVASTPGRGTTFTIFLPHASDEVPADTAVGAPDAGDFQ